jgi:hypothetical protein
VLDLGIKFKYIAIIESIDRQNRDCVDNFGDKGMARRLSDRIAPVTRRGFEGYECNAETPPLDREIKF